MQIVRAYQRTQGRRQRKENSRGRLATTFPFQYFLILPNSLKSTKQWKAEAVPSWDIWLTFFASMCECDALMTEIYFVLWPFCCRRSLMYIYFPWSWDRQDCSSVWLRLCRVVLFVSFTLYGLKYVIVCHNYIHCCAVSISVVCLVAPSDWDEGCCPQVKIMANSLVVYGSTRLFVLFSICWV